MPTVQSPRMGGILAAAQLLDAKRAAAENRGKKSRNHNSVKGTWRAN